MTERKRTKGQTTIYKTLAIAKIKGIGNDGQSKAHTI
jgi:hypothetical protein